MVGIIGSTSAPPGVTVAFEVAVCIGVPPPVFEGTIALLVAAAVLETTLELSLELSLLFAADELVEAEASELLEVEVAAVVSEVDWTLACRRGKTC
jgi:hypothetical protein